jgi:hypothetical protein
MAIRLVWEHLTGVHEDERRTRPNPAARERRHRERRTTTAITTAERHFGCPLGLIRGSTGIH